MSTALALSDLNTEVNHEPRVADLRLAEALGFADRHKIRTLIGRHMEALGRFGEVSAVRRKPGVAGGRPGTDYFLNKRQALYITAKSDTAIAADVTVQMVDVFDAWQRGSLEAEYASISPGTFRLTIGSRDVLADAATYQIGPRDEAVVCGHDGKIKILRGPLELSPMYGQLGRRSVAGPWKKSKVPGALREREYYTVLGRVVPAGENPRAAKAVKVRAHRRALPKKPGEGSEIAAPRSAEVPGVALSENQALSGHRYNVPLLH